MERRTAVGTLAFAVFGTPLLRFGEQLAELVVPATGPLPSRLSMAHVAEVEAETERLRDTGRQFGGQADAFCFAVARFTRWLGVPADDRVKAALGRALSELCTEAGWWCWDSGVSGLGFFTRAMRLADDARDGYGIVNAAWHAGATLVRSGHPDEALQCFQIGQSQIEGSWPGKSNPAILPKDDPRVPARAARLNLNSATAYALMDDPKQARNYLARARDGWAPRDAFERAYGDSATAGVELDLGRIEAAEPFAQAAVRTYHGAAHHRSRVLAELRLAEVHVRAGEPRGLTMARAAIDAVAPLRSVPVRRERLVPLADALDARPGSDARELAARARKVAAARG